MGGPDTVICHYLSSWESILYYSQILEQTLKGDAKDREHREWGTDRRNYQSWGSLLGFAMLVFFFSFTLLVVVQG